MLLAGGKESSQLEKWSEHSVSVQAHPTAETATLPSNHLGFNSSLIDLMEGSIANTSPRTHRGAELALAPPPQSHGWRDGLGPHISGRESGEDMVSILGKGSGFPALQRPGRKTDGN